MSWHWYLKFQKCKVYGSIFLFICLSHFPNSRRTGFHYLCIFLSNYTQVHLDLWINNTAKIMSICLGFNIFIPIWLVNLTYNEMYKFIKSTFWWSWYILLKVSSYLFPINLLQRKSLFFLLWINFCLIITLYKTNYIFWILTYI